MKLVYRNTKKPKYYIIAEANIPTFWYSKKEGVTAVLVNNNFLVAFTDDDIDRLYNFRSVSRLNIVGDKKDTVPEAVPL